ncbi:MAG: ABC transporter permease [Candidatus Omnitrophica bacterium]|nr:ABC transporter permease [Candidatus Omnitrophota bacterium]
MNRKTVPLVYSLAIPIGVGALVAIALAPFGETPLEGVTLLVKGAFGSWRRVSETLVKTSPLLFTGLAVALAFRCGAFNIGAEGQFLIGALASVAVGANLGLDSPWIGVPLVLGAAFLGGAIWGGIAGALKAWRDVPEVISTIMLNFIALFWISALIRGPLKNPTSGLPESPEVVEAAYLPRLSDLGDFPGYRVHLGLLLGILSAIAIWILLTRTVLGFKMRAVGFNPDAARFSGYHPKRIWAASLALSGAIAGLGGGIEVTAITFRIWDDFSPGYGYTAIAVALLARLHPLAVVLTAFFFGVLDQGAGLLQRDLGVPLVVIYLVQGLVILMTIGMGFHRPGEPGKEGGEK